MPSPSHQPPNLAPLLHLLAGALLGAGLVGLTLLKESNPAEDARAVFKRAIDWGILGAVGGLLGGIAAGVRTGDGATRSPGQRFWMLSLGAGGALTLGTIALRNAPSIPSGDDGGPAALVLKSLVVGWLAGVLVGAVGEAFARFAAPTLTVAILKATSGRPEKQSLFFGAMLGGAMWAVFWGLLVALLALLATGILLLSARVGGTVPALAVGATCGTILFALRYALSKGG